MGRLLLRRVAGAFAASSVVLVAAIAQPVTAGAAGTGTLFGISLRPTANLATIVPGSGAASQVADLTIAGQPAPGFGLSMASDAATHRLFLYRIFFDFSTGVPVQTNELVTVTTQSPFTVTSVQIAHPLTALAFEPSTGKLFGFTGDCCPNQIVTVDPAQGTMTHVADLNGFSFSNIALDPSTHLLYLASQSVGFPPSSQLVTVNTQLVDSVIYAPATSPGMRSLVFDTSSKKLFGITFFPPHFAQVDTSSGAASLLGSYDFGMFLEPGITIDSASDTVYAVQDVFDDPMLGPIAHIAAIKDTTGDGTLSGSTGTNLAAIAFEGVTITPDSIKADVTSALASRAIDSTGVARSLLAELNAAANARARGQCSAAAKVYQAFISEVTAQRGQHIAAATADQLISEAKFLIANCP
jgi:hypothetical protein